MFLECPRYKTFTIHPGNPGLLPRYHQGESAIQVAIMGHLRCQLQMAHGAVGPTRLAQSGPQHLRQVLHGLGTCTFVVHYLRDTRSRHSGVSICIRAGRPPRRPLPYVIGGAAPRTTAKTRPICIRYNKYNGDCRHGEMCKFRHVCSQCQGMHPRNQCKVPPTGSRAEE